MMRLWNENDGDWIVFMTGTSPVSGRCFLVLMEASGFVPDRIQGHLGWTSFQFGMS